MSNTMAISNIPESGELELKYPQHAIPPPQVHIPHQHRFVTSIPIKAMNIYNSESMCTVLQGLGPMSLVKCEGCGVTFISVLGQDTTMERRNRAVGQEIKRERRTSFEETFAAYYNTSQLSVGAN